MHRRHSLGPVCLYSNKGDASTKVARWRLESYLMGTQVCVQCARTSPATDSNHTLISARHGWRLTREQSASGQLAVAWRCPKCWQQRKVSRAVSAASKPDSETRVSADVKGNETPESVFARVRRHLSGKPSEPPSNE